MTMVPTKVPLGRNNGEIVSVSATAAGSPQKIHTARGVQQGWDEFRLYVGNSTDTDEQFFWRIGSTGMFFRLNVPASTDLLLVTPGIVIRGGVTIEVYASTADVLGVIGSAIENEVVEPDA